MGDPTAAIGLTHQAVRALEDGHGPRAQELLRQALAEDRSYGPAWMWFASTCENPHERRFCLERAQDAGDPSAEPALDALAGVEPSAPEALAAILDPAPPVLPSAQAEVRSRRGIIIGSLLVGALALGTAAWAASLDTRPLIRVAVVATDTAGGPLSGQEIDQAAQQAAQAWNSDERPTRIQTIYFDDKGTPEGAREVAQAIVEDGHYLAVLGHQYSGTSLAAAPIYAAAGIPVITATATADALTAGNPWQFRTDYDNSGQASDMAAYAAGILGGGSMSAIHVDNAYGNDLARALAASYTKDGETFTAHRVTPEADGSYSTSAITAAARAVAADQPTGPVAVLAGPDEAALIITALRSEGVTRPILGPDALSSGAFYEKLPTAAAGAGLFAAAPLGSATLTGDAGAFYENFAAQHGYRPSWQAGLVHDAVDVIGEAVARARFNPGKGEAAAQRKALRDALDSARSPETAFPALTGPLSFTPEHAAARTASFDTAYVSSTGRLDVQKFSTVPAREQLVPYTPEAGIGEAAAIASGDAVRVGGTTYTRQHVVSVGINLNEISGLNTDAGTFTADFFLWMRFTGDDEAVDVEFPNAVNPSLRIGPPVRTSVDGDVQYRLHRINATFKSPMNFRDFPFDSQQLRIIVQSRQAPAARITYTPDPELLAQSQTTRLESGASAGEPVDHIANWQAQTVTFVPSAVGSTASLGEPAATSGPLGVTFPQFITTVTIGRDVGSFLVRNALPLALLILVTYISLWLPYGETGRLNLAVSGILTGAVMLATVLSSLGNVDYTVAIEWAYYTFILLSASVVLMTIVGRALIDNGRPEAARRLSTFTRIAYPMAVLTTIAAYAVSFG